MRDDERFTRCWTQAQAAIAGYVSAMVPDPHQADDLLQNIAVALLRKFSEYDPGRPFIAWAMGIAKIEILTQRRDRARTSTRFRAATVETLSEVWQEMLPEFDERRQALSECMKGIAGRNLELVKLRYEEELEPRDIAPRLGLAAGAVRVALARIRAALQTCIERRLATDRR